LAEFSKDIWRKIEKVDLHWRSLESVDEERGIIHKLE